jgi:hypothetical protein
MPGGAPHRVQVDVVRASDGRKIEVAFATLVRNRADAVVVGADSFFTSRRQLPTLATRHAIPAVYNGRGFAETGGLMEYGTKVQRCIGSSASTPATSSRAPSLRTCQSCSRANSSWSSTLRLPGIADLQPAIPWE